MAKHRAWEQKQYVQENRTGDIQVPGLGSQSGIAFARKVTVGVRILLCGARPLIFFLLLLLFWVISLSAAQARKHTRIHTHTHTHTHARLQGKQKMVRNEKGLWVKVADESAELDAPNPETVSKVPIREHARERRGWG
jgi:hypothetical protein